MTIELYTSQEIAKLLEFCDVRTKALVLLLASSGMRVGAISELQLNHLAKIEKYHLYKVRVYAGYKEEHITFTTPEAAHSLDAYFAFRERYGEKITPSSPVIREQFNIEDQLIARHPKKVTANSLGEMIAYALQKSGIFESHRLTESKKSGAIRNAIHRAHGFRKFFETNLFRAKILDPIPEMLLGHDIGMKKHYIRLTEDEILEEYIKAVDLLTINEESRLRRKVIELTSSADRIDNLQEQIELLSHRLGLDHL